MYETASAESHWQKALILPTAAASASQEQVAASPQGDLLADLQCKHMCEMGLHILKRKEQKASTGYMCVSVCV